MCASTISEVSHESREIQSLQRKPSRLDRELPGRHNRISSTSLEVKIPKSVISSSSAEKSKLETLYSLNKARGIVIKSH
jgi:hypothetical protein